jgi:hypothetical protein
MLIDTPLLVVGRGPAPLLAAKVAAGYGTGCLLVGNHAVGDDEPVAFTAEAYAELQRHGLLDILRPYLVPGEPAAIAPSDFEYVVKHHCVADLNVTVYDQIEVIERVTVGRGVRGVLTDGTIRWDLTADRFIDGEQLPRALSDAIMAGAAAAMEALAAPPSTPASASPAGPR